VLDNRLHVVYEQQGVVKIEAQTGVQSIHAAPFYFVYTSGLRSAGAAAAEQSSLR
jgi:hypothetical protein